MLPTIRCPTSRSSPRSLRASPARARRRGRTSAPQRIAYGPSEFERLDIYRASRAGAPVFVYIHGGTWRWGAAKDAGFPAEMFVNAGAHYVALDFIQMQAAGGDLGALAAQIRGVIAWIYKNADSFGGDPERIYVGGHSSGGHLCGMVLATDWRNQFGIPDTAVKGGLCSPDGAPAKSGVGIQARTSLPDFTSFHPGYK